MECKACGYKQVFDFDQNKWIGDKNFIFIQDVEIENTYKKQLYLIIYACPECGTLKLDI